MKTPRLKEKWSDLSKNLEKLLQEPVESVAIPLQKKFELQVDFSHLEQQLSQLPKDHIEKIFTTFQKLNLHFVSGLLFETRDGESSVVALFNQGQIRVASDELHGSKMKLPNTNGFEVLMAPSQVFMKKMKLSWDPENRMRAFLIRPSADFAFVLFSPVPDLWMQSEIPKLVNLFKRIFSV
jgi:hypothetical protein